VDGIDLKPLIILGATGSIGRQTLNVAAHLGIPVAGIAANRASTELIAVARSVPEARVVVAGADAAPGAAQVDDLRSELGGRVAFGKEALLDLAATAGTVVVNGIVGAAGLAPTVAALDAGNRVALANKESLVAGGPVVVGAAAAGPGEIIPVDSEHSALWQCLVGEATQSVRRLILTASGGPFRGKTSADMKDVTVAQALAHPTWSMGRRITIDSATLMNKAFEVIEAHFLYAVPYELIDVLVHPQSIVHSLVEFVDGTLKAELGDPDMRVPIQYAITYPERAPASLAPFDLTASPLEFEPPDTAAFPCLDLGYAAGRAGGSATAVLNAADEVAVAAFLKGRIPFAAIASVVEAALEHHTVIDVGTVDEVLAVDEEARIIAAEYVEVMARTR
jgi:1-deoxy-D-xylulose-5-phosphate reductoisomerase